MYRSANLVTSAQCGTGETTKGRILFLRRHYPDQVQGTGGSTIPLHLSRTCVQRPCIRFVLRSDSFYLTAQGLSRNGGAGGVPPPYSLFTFPSSFYLWGAASQTRPRYCVGCGAHQTTPQTNDLSVTFKDGGYGSKTVSFSLLEKERFLESKEKGAPKRVEWSQIGIRRPGFTPPLCTSTVHRRLRWWNRDKRWFYPTFFRRLRRWVSGRGAAAWYYLHCMRGAAPFLFPFSSSF